MKLNTWKDWTYSVVSPVHGVTLLVTPALAAGQKYDLGTYLLENGFIAPGCWLLENGDGATLLSAVGLAVTAACKRWLGNRWAKETLQAFLNDFRKVAFRNGANNAEFHDRVTLFKYQKWLCNPRRWNGRKPWGGWLVPVMRSGHTTKNTSTVFWTPEDDPDRAEGVAGVAWTQNCIVIRNNLPEITLSSSEEDIAKYCAETWSPKDFITQRLQQSKPIARSYYGIPVRIGEYQPWGVVLLDSRSPDGVLDDETADKLYKIAGTTIGKLLKSIDR